MIQSYQNKSVFIHIFILLSIAVLYTVWFWLRPLAIDDYMFMAIWKNINGSEEFSFSGLSRFYDFIRQSDNGRIANLLAPFSSLFSPFKELFPILTGIIISIISWISVNFIEPQNQTRKTFYLLLFWCCGIIFLPWYNSILFADYALNYVWSSCITLILLFIFWRNEPKSWTASSLIIGCITAIFAGGWHESFAAATICGLGLYLLIKKGRCSWQFYLVLFVYILSTILFALSPGILGRFGYSIGEEHKLPHPRYFIITFILFLYIITFLFSKTGRSKLLDIIKSPLFIIGCGIILAGYAIGIATINQARCYFWPNLISIILLLFIFAKSNIANQIFCRKYLIKAVNILLFLICSAEMIVISIFEKNYRNEYNQILTKIIESEDGIAFYDIKLPTRNPYYTLNIPMAEIWTGSWQYRVLSWYYGKPFISVVPQELYETEYDNLPLSESKFQLKEFQGKIISPYENLDEYENLGIPGVKILSTTTSDGSNYEYKVLASPFITKEYLHKDGIIKKDTLLYFNISNTENLNISSIDSIKNGKTDAFPLMYKTFYQDHSQ